MENKKKTDKPRDTEDEERPERGRETLLRTGITEDRRQELDESTAGPSREEQSGIKKQRTYIEKFQVTEEEDAPLKTMSLLEDSSMNEKPMVTPGEYISLSDESETEEEVKGKTRIRRNLRSASKTDKAISKKVRKRLYGDSEDKEPESVGIDTPLLLKLNEMTANDVAAKAYSYVRTIEDIRMKSGRLQGALSGKIKRALESINDTITCLTRKATEKGDIEYVRKQNIELTRENMKLAGNMQIIKQENDVYKRKERENGQRINRMDKDTQTEIIEEVQAIGEIEGRKRRRIESQEPEIARYAFYSSDAEPRTSEGEQMYTETEDDTCSDLIKEYKRTARISYRRTETALFSAKNIMKEIDETTDDNKPKEIEKDNTEETTIQHVLREIKTVIEKHLNKAEQNVKSKKGKPIIKKVESVQMKIPFMENRPRRDVTWADVIAKRKSPEKQHRRNDKNERKESEKYSTDEQELQRKEDRIGRKTRQYKTVKPEEIIEKKKKKTAAISITTRGEITNREVMIKAKREIVLKDYGIENCQIRSGFTGGLVIEIPGEDAESKADRSAKVERYL